METCRPDVGNIVNLASWRQARALPIDHNHYPDTLTLLMANLPKHPLPDSSTTLKDRPEETATRTGDSPRFGLLLVILALAVLLIVAITFASESYFSS